jgi:hypothetical protein
MLQPCELPPDKAEICVQWVKGTKKPGEPGLKTNKQN